jgi:peptidoglycan/LPS O-acetylase OafA/YrhL
MVRVGQRAGTRWLVEKSTWLRDGEQAMTWDRATSGSERRVPQLDAVRGLAILMVMAHNISLKYPVMGSAWWTKDGWMGVDLFFALSGFLITGILLDTKGARKYFENFYARRILRIWPLYYALLLFMFVGMRFLSRAEYAKVLETSSPWWAFPLFLQNFLLPSTIYAAGPLAVTWSLTIEEQFYLVWAPVVRFCTAKTLWTLAIVEICLSPGLRYFLATRHVDLYTNVFCRLDGLMAGAILAVLVRRKGFAPARWLTRAWILLVASGALAVGIEALHARWIVFTFTALASAGFIFVAMYSPQRRLQAVMANRFLRYSGIVSYGLYLLHKIPFGAVQMLGLDRRAWVPAPFILLTSYALAMVSWNVLEKPFLRLKRYFGTAATA